MKALKITFEHGRIWRVETSDGRSAIGASLVTALEKVGQPVGAMTASIYLGEVFDSIQDSGGSGNIARGQASG